MIIFPQESQLRQFCNDHSDEFSFCSCFCILMFVNCTESPHDQEDEEIEVVGIVSRVKKKKKEEDEKKKKKKTKERRTSG